MVGVIASVSKETPKAARRGGEHVGRSCHVGGVTRREVDNSWPSKNVGEGVDLGGMPAP